MGGSNKGPRAVKLHIWCENDTQVKADAISEGWKRWRLSNITRASACVVAGDVHIKDYMVTYGNSTRYDWERHKDLCNFLYMDSHVEGIKGDAVDAYAGLTPINKFFLTGWNSGTSWTVP